MALGFAGPGSHAYNALNDKTFCSQHTGAFPMSRTATETRPVSKPGDEAAPAPTAAPGHAYSYDQVPYLSNPFPQSQPEQLAVVAKLFGLDPVLPSHARVLELGCSAGGNLIPLAARYPDAQFLGIDLSNVEVAEGQAMVKSLGLTNIEIRQQDITDMRDQGAKYDYIICHGVYSWIPDHAQDAALAIYGGCLSERGVGYISYNTYPGWKLREVIRDLMLYHVDKIREPAQRIAQARAIFQHIQKISDPESAFGKFLKNEADILSRSQDSYLFHEHLETNNHPCYFKDFVARADAHGLAYLGEAAVADMAPQRFGNETFQTLQQLAGGNVIATEQYMDFFRNRTFRQTLLVKQAQRPQIRRNINPDSLKPFYLSARIVGAEGAAMHSTDDTTYKDAAGRTVKLKEPFLKAAIMALSDALPSPLSFDEWLKLARIKLSGRDVGGDNDVRQLNEVLVHMSVSGMLNLHIERNAYGSAEDTHPCAFSPVRHQAQQRRDSVTNLRHELVRISDFDRAVLPLLDGSLDTPTLKDQIVSRAMNREFTVARDNVQIHAEEELRPAVSGLIDAALKGYEKNALLS
jgi:methyltransferase-like protein/ubiquinone/menaquinone biosynthesis C-methylase UbiE